MSSHACGPASTASQWSRRVAAARAERARGPATEAADGRTGLGPAGRELFRALRALLG